MSVLLSDHWVLEQAGAPEGAAGWRGLALTARRWPLLEELHYSGGGALMGAADAAEPLPRLLSLRLKGCVVPPLLAELLPSLSQLQLEEVSVGAPAVIDGQIEAQQTQHTAALAASLAAMPSLRELQLVESRGWVDWAPPALFRSPHLGRLIVQQAHPLSLPQDAHMPQLTSLTLALRLDVPWEPFRPAAPAARTLQWPASMCAAPLQRLKLVGFTAGAALPAEVSRLLSLRTLVLAETKLRGGLDDLSSLLRLRDLRCNAMQVAPPDARLCLAGLRCAQHLTRLEFCACALTLLPDMDAATRLRKAVFAEGELHARGVALAAAAHSSMQEAWRPEVAALAARRPLLSIEFPADPEEAGLLA